MTPILEQINALNEKLIALSESIATYMQQNKEAKSEIEDLKQGQFEISLTITKLHKEIKETQIEIEILEEKLQKVRSKYLSKQRSPRT